MNSNLKTDEELRKELSDMFENEMGIIPGSLLIDGHIKLETATSEQLDLIAARYRKTRNKVSVPWQTEFQSEYSPDGKCTHPRWIPYHGFSRSYEYCEKCDEKRELRS